MKYQIGDFSRISGLGIKTLRYYHECGLLKPTDISDESGYRYYDESCLERAGIINKLKELNFPLKEIKDIIDMCKDDSDLVNLAIQKSKEIKEEIVRYSEMQKKLEVFIAQAKWLEEPKMSAVHSEIVIKNIPDTLVASIRFKGKYQEISGAFHKLFRACGKYSCGTPFALYYDKDYKEEDADMEACIPVKVPTGTGDSDIKCSTLKGGKALTVIHKGPYDKHGESYKILIDHITENLLKVCSPYREVYLKGPGIILPRSPKRYVTEIQILLDRSI